MATNAVMDKRRRSRYQADPWRDGVAWLAGPVLIEQVLLLVGLSAVVRGGTCPPSITAVTVATYLMWAAPTFSPWYPLAQPLWWRGGSVKKTGTPQRECVSKRWRWR